MREAAPRLLTRDQLSWLAVLRADRDNILAALRYWCDADDAGNALSLAISLSVMALLLGNDTEMAEWIGDALAVPGEADPALRAMAEALHVITSFMVPTAAGGGGAAGTYPGLIERLDTLDIEKHPVAGLLRPVFAMFANDEGRLRAYLDQARASRDEWLVAATWMMTAGLAENNGNLTEMRVAAAEAVERFRAVGERWGLSSALRTVGNVGLLDGDLDGAIAAYTEAGRLLAEIGHREDMSQVQLRLAEIAARQGDLVKARELSAGARSAAESEGSQIDRGIAVAWWAGFEATWGDVDAARPLHAETERLLARFSPAHPVREHLEAGAATTGAMIALADGDVGIAREQAARAYRAAVSAQDMPLLALASGAVAELAFMLGQHERAAELLGAGTVVRGAEDPTDPTALKLAPLLRAALGPGRYEAAYESGRELSRPAAIERLDPAGLD